MRLKTIVLAILGLAVVAFLVVCGLAAITPDAFVIEETVTIDAPREAIYAYNSRLKNWETWSPWKAEDATIQNTYEGPEEGVGATQHWTSKRSGSGTLKITEVIPPEVLRYELAFDEWNAKNRGELRMITEGTQTNVTWVMSGTRGFKEKFFVTIFCVDDLLHDQFKKGLSLLKAQMEKPTS